MLKVIFKDDYKKVQTFNDRVVVVTLVGYLTIPIKLSSVFPKKVANWVRNHPSVNASWGICTKESDVIRLECSCKALCAKEDNFDAIIGERIAESRAKMKLYHFMETLTQQLIDYFKFLLIGKDGIIADYDLKESHLCAINDKYSKLEFNEHLHHDKLLEEA